MTKRSLTIVTIMLSLVAAAAIAGPAAQGRSQADGTPSPAANGIVDGLVVVESAHGVAETLDRLAAMLEANGVTVVARVDHAANAAGTGEDLRPTQLLIFGNPMLGTPLMQSAQTIGIDLPQKFLAWEDEGGQVHLAYNDPFFLAERHGIDDQDDVLQQTADTLAMQAAGAAAPAAGTPAA